VLLSGTAASLTGGGIAVVVNAGDKLIVQSSVVVVLPLPGGSPTPCFVNLLIDSVLVQQQPVMVTPYTGSSPAGVVVPFTFETPALGAGSHTVDITAVATAGAIANPSPANGGILIERVGV